MRRSRTPPRAAPARPPPRIRRRAAGTGAAGHAGRAAGTRACPWTSGDPPSPSRWAHRARCRCRARCIPGSIRGARAPRAIGKTRARPGSCGYDGAPRTTADSCTTAPASSARTTPRRGTAYPACTAAPPRHSPPRSTPPRSTRRRRTGNANQWTSWGAPRGGGPGRAPGHAGGPGRRGPGSIPVGGAHAPYDMAMEAAKPEARSAAAGARGTPREVPRGVARRVAPPTAGSCWTRCAAARR